MPISLATIIGEMDVGNHQLSNNTLVNFNAGGYGGIPGGPDTTEAGKQNIVYNYLFDQGGTADGGDVGTLNGIISGALPALSAAMIGVIASDAGAGLPIAAVGNNPGKYDVLTAHSLARIITLNNVARFNIGLVMPHPNWVLAVNGGYLAGIINSDPNIDTLDLAAIAGNNVAAVNVGTVTAILGHPTSQVPANIPGIIAALNIGGGGATAVNIASAIAADGTGNISATMLVALAAVPAVRTNPACLNAILEHSNLDTPTVEALAVGGNQAMLRLVIGGQQWPAWKLRLIADSPTVKADNVGAGCCVDLILSQASADVRVIDKLDLAMNSGAIRLLIGPGPAYSKQVAAALEARQELAGSNFAALPNRDPFEVSYQQVAFVVRNDIEPEESLGNRLGILRAAAKAIGSNRAVGSMVVQELNKLGHEGQMEANKIILDGKSLGLKHVF